MEIGGGAVNTVTSGGGTAPHLKVPFDGNVGWANWTGGGYVT